MGKASRNARNHLTKTFALLQNTGKSIWGISLVAKCDPKTVFLHFSPDGDGRRRNEGFVPYLRKCGAHWTIIAAAQGMSYDEIKERDSSGKRPSGAWLQGKTLVVSEEDQSSEAFPTVDDVLDHDENNDDEEMAGLTLVSELLDSSPIDDSASSKEDVTFSQGQRVQLTEDSIAAREELIPFSGEAALIVHVNGLQILIRKISDHEDETESDAGYHQIVSPEDIVTVVEMSEPKVGDEVIYTKVGEASRAARILAIQQSITETPYSLRLSDDSSYEFASRAEITTIVNTRSIPTIDQKFYLKENGCEAVGIADDKGGITVLRGSRGKGKTSKGKTDRENIVNDRLELFEDQKVRIVEDSIELVEDHYFKSFFRASSGLMGYNTSGQKWKTLDGKTYAQTRQEKNSPEELFGV